MNPTHTWFKLSDGEYACRQCEICSCHSPTEAGIDCPLAVESEPQGFRGDTMSDRIEEACEIMHDAYERAAVGAGWETQEASRKQWSDVPEANKITMRTAVSALIEHLDGETQGSGSES